MKYGIDVPKVILLSERIRNAWSFYFWNFSFCQKHIRFTAEERTNYVGDLLLYFDDTVHLLENIQFGANYRSALYDSVAVLQFMYIQQDLIDEVLCIFRLPSGLVSDKNPIRTIRNELIGHPIRRERNHDLLSSVFITQDSHSGILQYVRYHKENDYDFEIVRYDWATLFRQHENYIMQQLTHIHNKVCKVIKLFSKQLEGLKSNMLKMPFESLVAVVNQLYEIFHKHSYLYNGENIIYCHRRRKDHPRYENAVALYYEGLREYLEETVKNIGEYISSTLEVEPAKEVVPLEWPTIIETNGDEHQPNPMDSYVFSKLFEKHPIFGLDFFKRQFEKDEEIMVELENMGKNLDNDAEYYSSYELLRKIFLKRNFI